MRILSSGIFWGWFLGILTVIVICSTSFATDASEIPDSELKPTSQPISDQIAIKQTEMLSTIVYVSTYLASGSGSIIGRTNNDLDNEQTKNIFTYSILTNAHVIDDRTLTILVGADSLRGKPRTYIIDYGVQVVAFNAGTDIIADGPAVIIAECEILDLAILTFETIVELPVVNLLSSEMLDQIRVFDEVYAVGCQLGRPPLPTDGIISAIVGANNGYLAYTNNAQIAGGSSGGGLFKEYNGHYYLIGVPSSVAFACNGQFLPHLSSAISLVSAQEMINNYVGIDFGGE